MTSTTDLRAVAEELRAQRDTKSARATQLRSALDDVLNEIKTLDTVIDGLETLGAPAAPGVSQVQPPRAEEQVTEEEPSFAGRPKTADMVEESVNNLGRRATRDEIFDQFVKDHGIPETWGGNPKNAFNTALHRAVERRMVRRVGLREYAPMNLRDAASRTQLSLGGGDA